MQTQPAAELELQMSSYPSAPLLSNWSADELLLFAQPKSEDDAFTTSVLLRHVLKLPTGARPLDTFLRERPHLHTCSSQPCSCAIEISLGAARALCALHEVGYCHNDVRTGVFLVAQDGILLGGMWGSGPAGVQHVRSQAR
jgi:hypothetical protein